MARCGIIVQFKHECRLDTKTNSIRLSSGGEMHRGNYNLRKTETSHEVREVSVQRVSANEVNIKVANNCKLRKVRLMYILK